MDVKENLFIYNFLIWCMHQGARVRLIPLEKRHFAKSLEWLKDSTVTEYLPVSGTVDREEEIKSLEHLLKSGYARGFAAETLEGEHIGNGVLHHIDFRNRKAEFSGLVGEKRLWGKGYAVEGFAIALKIAFEDLKLNKVYVRISIDNKRAQKFCEKMGFKKEGVLRQDVLKNGKFIDFWMCSLLAEEYLQMSKMYERIASETDV